ncbi:MAG: hypothetical protein A2057_02690 [Ignavibacteria bacterium GWA2_35_9]|nr:MAG: hypothetical protein A2057_02690 [Ignavibacteria bacterium GWA2_35_9]OGU49030.1 MAG: hypothetical protein A2080_03080 [Ignavibacteria bacterium GWC2_36_12]OGU95265.1 MAG: hypothetical protein A2330_05495 [Ignavibacteria bacterium RIFOXYB2_FULL_36_7]
MRFLNRNIPHTLPSLPTLEISSNKKGYEIRKEFGSRKLVGDYIFEETDGRRYRRLDSYRSQKDFNEFGLEELKYLAKNVS